MTLWWSSRDPVCMYVCMYVRVCTYVCMYVHMYVYVRTCVYVCRYVCMYVCREDWQCNSAGLRMLGVCGGGGGGGVKFGGMDKRRGEAQ